MFVLTIKFVILLVVIVEGVHAGRRFGGDRRSYYQESKPISFRTKLRSLESQLDLCLGKFLCGTKTVDNRCQIECIDEDNVCDSTRDCNNGRDEINCSGRQFSIPCPTCPTCPTMQPCPECPTETPCPSSGCPTGQIRCRDGSTCKAIQDICDGTANSPQWLSPFIK